MDAGRRAYLHVWPDDDSAAAAADATPLGRALYQLAHAVPAPLSCRSKPALDIDSPLGRFQRAERPQFRDFAVADFRLRIVRRSPHGWRACSA